MTGALERALADLGIDYAVIDRMPWWNPFRRLRPLLRGSAPVGAGPVGLRRVEAVLWVFEAPSACARYRYSLARLAYN